MQQNISGKLDVICIGNAIVDIFSFVDDEQLSKLKSVPGSMYLITEEESNQLYQLITHDKIFPGGSVSNTAAAIASFGGEVALIGKVAEDQLGKFYAEDMQRSNVYFACNFSTTSMNTGRSYIFISQHGKERTMHTYLGAASELSEKDVDEELIKNSKILFIEGYMWDKENTRAAVLKALYIAKKYNIKIAFTLSDRFCIERHKADFRQLVFNQADILFCNKKEACTIFETSNFDEVIKAAQEKSKVFVVTLGAAGSIIVNKQGIHKIEAEKVDNLVDTTGAGDVFAAGVLYGLSKGMNLEECGQLGNIASAENVTHVGARPQIELAQILREKFKVGR